MEVMEKMLGKWKVDLNKRENFDAYVEALALTPDQVERMRTDESVTTTTRDGDTFTMVTDSGGATETITFRLGETFKAVRYGIETENVLRMEGEVLVGRHCYLGKTSLSRRYFQGNDLILEVEGNGAIMKTTLVKC